MDIVIRPLPVEPGLENGFDRGIAGRVDLKRALASRLHTGGFIPPDKGQNAQRPPVPLFRVGPVAERALDEDQGVFADQVGTALQSFRRPVGIMPVVRGHVRRNGDVASSPAASNMAGDTFMFVEDLDRLVGQARTDTAADQDVGNGVEGMIDLDMVVEVYFLAFPFGILKGGIPGYG